jgi:hypothetical protein
MDRDLAALIAFVSGVLKVLAALMTVDVLNHWNFVQSHTKHSEGYFHLELLMASVFGLSLLWGGFAAWRVWTPGRCSCRRQVWWHITWRCRWG